MIHSMKLLVYLSKKVHKGLLNIHQKIILRYHCLYVLSLHKNSFDLRSEEKIKMKVQC